MAPCPLARAGDQYRDVRGRDFRGRYRPLGPGLAWRARAALAKGLSLLLLGLWVLAGTVWMAAHGTLPAAGTMGAIGIAALVANLVCAVILWRHRDGDANRRSVWICSRNDAIGNIAVVAAAAGVFGTGTAWPDLIVALVLRSEEHTSELQSLMRI